MASSLHDLMKTPMSPLIDGDKHWCRGRSLNVSAVNQNSVQIRRPVSEWLITFVFIHVIRISWKKCNCQISRIFAHSWNGNAAIIPLFNWTFSKVPVKVIWRLEPTWFKYVKPVVISTSCHSVPIAAWNRTYFFTKIKIVAILLISFQLPASVIIRVQKWQSVKGTPQIWLANNDKQAEHLWFVDLQWWQLDVRIIKKVHYVSKFNNNIVNWCEFCFRIWYNFNCYNQICFNSTELWYQDSFLPGVTNNLKS